MTKTEAAYIAGLLDGEGTVSFYLRPAGRKDENGRYRLYGRLEVNIYNTNLEVLLWVARKTKLGKIFTKTRKKDKKYKHYKTCYHWRTQSAGARAFLAEIRPYLIIKARIVDEKLTADAKSIRPNSTKR